MPVTYKKNDYLIARGRVFFDPFDASENRTGEIYLGNCPSVTINIETEEAEHYSSEAGMREKDGSWVVEVKRTGSLTCDNFSPANAALWLSGTHEVKSQTATPVEAEEITVVPGRLYQLGQTSLNPLGVRNVSAVAVKSDDGLTTYAAGTDYNVDLETGRIQILESGTIAAGVIKVDYTPVAGQYEAVKSGANAKLYGSLRIVSDNATGGNRDWYFPKVTLLPSGELPLVAEGTDVVTMEFGLEVLKSANAEAIYVDGRPYAAS